MFWQEDENDGTFQVPDDVVDVLFSIECKRLPVDHAYALFAALREALPWLESADSGVAVHTVHVAGSQNGWERPEHSPDEHLIVSRRTKLTIRVSKKRSDKLMDDLRDKTLDVSGCPLTVRDGKIRRLSKETTLFSRYVASGPDHSEDDFLAWTAKNLANLDIRIRKALCGKKTLLSTPDGVIDTRSLMLANLSPEESIRLQEEGLGPQRQMGCGIFIPHKGIDAVKKAS